MAREFVIARGTAAILHGHDLLMLERPSSRMQGVLRPFTSSSSSHLVATCVAVRLAVAYLFGQCTNCSMKDLMVGQIFMLRELAQYFHVFSS